MSEILEVGIKLSFSEEQTFTNEEMETLAYFIQILFSSSIAEQLNPTFCNYKHVQEVGWSY